MERKRNCVYKFITKSQQSFAEGVSLGSVLHTTDHYQSLVRTFYGRKSVWSHPLHRIGTSKAGLSTIAVYEYMRYKGLPFPDANNVIQSIGSWKKSLHFICGSKPAFEDKQDLITF